MINVLLKPLTQRTFGRTFYVLWSDMASESKQRTTAQGRAIFPPVRYLAVVLGVMPTAFIPSLRRPPYQSASLPMLFLGREGPKLKETGRSSAESIRLRRRRKLRVSSWVSSSRRGTMKALRRVPSSGRIGRTAQAVIPGRLCIFAAIRAG